MWKSGGECGLVLREGGMLHSFTAVGNKLLAICVSQASVTQPI